jgi:carboxymethylenebutenolidase
MTGMIAMLGPDIELVVDGGRRFNAAVARPERAGPHPGVVVIHEVFGDQPEMRAVCEEFARHGYVAVMPNLFSGRGPRPICVARTMIDASRGKVNDDIDAARSWLAQQEEVDGERIGIIGFCMGGGFALAYVAGGRPGVRAVAVNYGEVPRESASLRGACPIVGSYGARDKVIGRSHAERLSRHLEALAIEHDVKVYDDAGHSFMTQGHHPIGKVVYLPMRVGYVQDAAVDAWERVFAFFDARLRPT